MRSDPLQELIEGHERVSEWLDIKKNASGLLEVEVPADLIQLQVFFRRHVLDHFAYEDRQVFPALLAVDPSPGTHALVAELREEHKQILAACGRLFTDLAWCLTTEDVPAAIRARQPQAQELLDTVLAHAGREDARLLPLVETHRQQLAAIIRDTENQAYQASNCCSPPS